MNIPVETNVVPPVAKGPVVFTHKCPECGTEWPCIGGACPHPEMHYDCIPCQVRTDKWRRVLA